MENERRFHQTNRIDGDPEAVPAAGPIAVPQIPKVLRIEMDDGVLHLDPFDPKLPVEQSGKIEIDLQAPGMPGRWFRRAFGPCDLDILQHERGTRQPGESDRTLDPYRPTQSPARTLGEQRLVEL